MRTTLEKNLLEAIAQANNTSPSAIRTKAATWSATAKRGVPAPSLVEPGHEQNRRTEHAVQEADGLVPAFRVLLDLDALGGQFRVAGEHPHRVERDEGQVQADEGPALDPIQLPRRAKQRHGLDQDEKANLNETPNDGVHCTPRNYCK